MTVQRIGYRIDIFCRVRLIALRHTRTSDPIFSLACRAQSSKLGMQIWTPDTAI